MAEPVLTGCPETAHEGWIEWRLHRHSKEEILDPSIALFPNPSARNPEKRWVVNAPREEWNRAAEKVGVRVGMYESTKHSSATVESVLWLRSLNNGCLAARVLAVPEGIIRA